MRPQTIQVGDKVRFDLGRRDVVGRVREDRGPIGVGGRNLYGIDYELGEGNSYYVELPASEIEVIEPKAKRA